MLAHAEKAIEALLVERPEAATASLTDLENIVLKARHTFEQGLTQTLVDASSAEVRRHWPTWPTCGRRLQLKGKRKRRVETRTGEVELQRMYYHCRACHTGVFPPR